MKITLGIFAALILHLQSFGQNTEDGLITEPGKCYAKCLISEKEAPKALQSTHIQEDGTKKYISRFPNRRVKPGGYTEWKEVICEAEIDSLLISKLQSALIALGYDEELPEANGKMNHITRNNLVQYQRDHKLPIGQLDLETLDHLGIK